MAGTFPSAWQEVCLVTIQKAGGTAYEFHAISSTVDISEPDYPWEGIPNLAGGRIPKQSPQEDGEVTFEMYAVRTDPNIDNGGLHQHHVGGTADTSQPLITDTSWVAGVHRQRDTFLVAIRWTTDTAMTSATEVTSTADKTALRFYAKLARLTSHKSSFTDGILKQTVTFKFPAMNPTGTTAPWAWESTDDTDTSVQPALTYTSATDL